MINTEQSTEKVIYSRFAVKVTFIHCSVGGTGVTYLHLKRGDVIF